MGEVTDKAERVGRKAGNSQWMDYAVRIGMVAYGVVHLVIAWLALQLAIGESAGSVSSKGAIHELAQQPMGLALIWLVAIGMFLLVIWRLLEAAFGHADKDGAALWGKRAMDVGKAIIYGTVGVIALTTALGSGSGSSKKSTSETVSAKLLDLPWGGFLVGAIGVGIMVYGGSLIWKGFSGKHAEHLAAEGKSGDAGRAYLMLGKVGYIAKGIAIILIGILFAYAAATHDAKKSGGLDQALGTLLKQPFGPYLLGAIAIGIGCYGLFCFARARHLSR